MSAMEEFENQFGILSAEITSKINQVPNLSGGDCIPSTIRRTSSQANVRLPTLDSILTFTKLRPKLGFNKLLIINRLHNIQTQVNYHIDFFVCCEGKK